MEDFKLKIFTVLQRTGSFTAAAAELGISQPAVSQNIAELEKSLGVKLFDRSRGKLRITPAGRIFRHYAENIMQGYATLNSAFSQVPRNGGRLNLYFSPVLRDILSRDVLYAISVLHPELETVAVDDISLAEISVIGSADKNRKDAAIIIDVSVFPKNHPLAELVSRAVEISRFGELLSD